MPVTRYSPMRMKTSTLAGQPDRPAVRFLPGIGPLDDIVVAALVLHWVARLLGRDYLRAYWPGGDDGIALVERLL